MSDSQALKEIIVIGAGVIGLTTAVKIQEKGGYHVTIIAEVLPTDPKTIKYTSHWAGAQHCSHPEAVDAHENQLEMDKETFNTMWDMSAPGGPAHKFFMRLTMKDYYASKSATPHPLAFMPDFKEMAMDELPLGITDGVSFTTLTIDTMAYLPYLLSRFLSQGGTIVRGHVQHVSQLHHGVGDLVPGRASPAPSAIVVCTGLGARFLGGVEDKDMLPIRGQVVLVRAPWVKEMPCFETLEGESCYVIPRSSGDVTVGGTFLKDDWNPKPRPHTKQEILERALRFYPTLAPPQVRAVRDPTIADLEAIVIEDGVGHRPGRKQGIRLETDITGKIPLVFNYGHGAYGFQSSWGTASVALKLLESVLANV